MDLDYTALAEEIVNFLESAQTLTLATCSGTKVTARSMATVNDGLSILFQTSGLSEKTQQLRENHNVAFSAGNMQVEAVARVTEDPTELQMFIEKYKQKYPHYYAAYSGMPNEVTVICVPERIALYKFIDRKPCVDVLAIRERRAYRKVLA